MTLKKTMYVRMIQCLAARHCYAAGQSIQEIAASANKSPSTIRRWLKKAGVL
jgi:transposase